MPRWRLLPSWSVFDFLRVTMAPARANSRLDALGGVAKPRQDARGLRRA
jgi:hypothetical protein